MRGSALHTNHPHKSSWVHKVFTSTKQMYPGWISSHDSTSIFFLNQYCVGQRVLSRSLEQAKTSFINLKKLKHFTVFSPHSQLNTVSRYHKQPICLFTVPMSNWCQCNGLIPCVDTGSQNKIETGVLLSEAVPQETQQLAYIWSPGTRTGAKKNWH